MNRELIEVEPVPREPGFMRVRRPGGVWHTVRDRWLGDAITSEACDTCHEQHTAICHHSKA